MKRKVDVSVPLGPVHPCWKEPVRIKCETAGERVLSAEIELGYMKKGIEKIMRGRPWQEVMFLAERVCGICSVIHNLTFIEALEKINGIVPTPRAAYLRVICNELDRIQSHLLANFSYCYTIEHETIAMYLLNIRETTMDQLERLSGARVNCAYIIPGGVRFDLPVDEYPGLLAGLSKIEKDTRRYMKMFEGAPLVALRSKGVGVMPHDEAIKAHVVGPTARASALPESDLRLKHPTYRELGFTPLSRKEGDNFARIMVRFEEVFQSIELIRKCLEIMPGGDIRNGAVCNTAGYTEYSGEAPRGELTYFLEIDEYGRVTDIAIRPPSVMNIEACTHYMLTEVTSVADVSSTFISADPCVACNER